MEPKKGYQTELKIRNMSLTEEGRSRHVEMSKLESSLTQKIEAVDLFMSPNCCIFKTPEILSRHNAKAFLPIALSIGPFHHGKESLKATEKIKHHYMKGLVCRSKIPVSRFIEVIEKIEKEARESYAGPIELTEDDFVEMLVLDGCFIIELFRKNAFKKLRDEDDPIFTTCSLLQCLHHDLILLENQIPWKVLEVLFDLTTPDIRPLYLLAISFFQTMFSPEQLSTELLLKTEFANHRSKHILDLLRNWLVIPSQYVQKPEMTDGDQSEESSKDESNNILGWQLFPSATNIEEAGVKFVKVKANSILEVKFKFENGTLEIPSLLIKDSTETVFRNLVSFEQCTPNYTPIITSYAILMDNLIGSTKDMEILCKNKIIVNWVDLEDATQFFNKLNNDTYVKKFYYQGLCIEVNKYCERRWPRARASLLHNYFYSPWAIFGVTFAATVWVLTFLQTYFTISKK